MLVENLHHQAERSIEQLKQTDVNTLTETRGVGRKTNSFNCYRFIVSCG